MANLFPIVEKNVMSIESIAARLDYFFSQLHLIHLQTTSFAEHKALDFYSKIPDYKDEILEKLMGYTGRRVKAYKIQAIVDGASSSVVVKDLSTFAKQLEDWAEQNEYCDIENIAQSLSGDANKILFLLTLS